jgi:putative ABC transport system permease protein
VSFREAIRLAFAQLRVQKLKSFFTLLGVTIGVMFLIAVVSIVEGMGSYMENDFAAKIIGVNTFQLRRFPDIQMGNITSQTWREWQRRKRITLDDVHAVAAALPPDARWAIESGDQLEVSSPYARPSRLWVEAVGGEYFAIRNLGVERGRLISTQEMELGNRVVVIGRDVAERKFRNLDPLGRRLSIAGTQYEVIGVAEKQGSVFGISLDRMVITSASSPLQRQVNPHRVVDGMKIQLPTTEAMIETQEIVRSVMRQRHRLRPAQPDDFAVESSESALAFWAGVKSKLIVAGAVLPAVGLVVGAIVIMNIMLVAVAERTREIGIRKALGARRRDILSQFVIEAGTLSAIGAAAGVVIGIGLSKLIAALSPLPAAVAPWSVVAAIAMGAGVGVVAGVYPATRAARLDPVQALRSE